MCVSVYMCVSFECACVRYECRVPLLLEHGVVEHGGNDAGAVDGGVGVGRADQDLELPHVCVHVRVCVHVCLCVYQVFEHSPKIILGVRVTRRV